MKSWHFEAGIDLSISPDVQIKHLKSNATCLKRSRKENVEVFVCEVRCKGLIIPTKHEYRDSLPQRRVNLVNLRSALKFLRPRIIQMRFWLHKKACCQTNLAWPVSSIRAHSIFIWEISLPFDKQSPRLTALSLTSSMPIILAFPLWQHFPLRSDLGCVFRFLLPLCEGGSGLTPTFNYQCSVGLR